MSTHKNTGRKRPDLAKRNRDNATHKMTGNPTYITWCRMKQRAVNFTDPNSPRYKELGITVCDRWKHSFESFYEDMGERPDGCTLDRIDNEKGYFKDNCRWATQKQQQRNRSSNKNITWNNKIQCISQWADDLGMCRKVLEYRIRNWDLEKAMTTPYKPRKESK